MARMRPHLIPVFDERVHLRMGKPHGWWEFHIAWWDQGHVTAVEQMRRQVGGVEDISLLRIWDVAVWRYDVAVRPERYGAVSNH